MKKLNRILSMLLAVLMIVGSVTAISGIQVFAAEEGENSGNDNNSGDAETPKVEAQEEIDYTTQIYATPEEKLATMKLAYEDTKNGYQLYVDEYSGEVACVNTVTGEKLFTNPYDVGASTGDATTKAQILSQIIVHFSDNQGQEKTFTSYEEAVLRDQIIVENIRNGIRVEYTIGREQSKTLVPRLISKERFDKYILAPLLEAFGDALYEPAETKEMQDIQGFLIYYTLNAKEDLGMTSREESIFGGVYDNLISSDRELTLKLKDYPAIDRMPVFVFNPNASEAEIARCEELILTYCPDYTYEELEYDHTLTEYESDDENPPVFRMALEYKIEEDGLSVKLPANGIRFNESLYTLENIEILPYMGAGNSAYEGYNFFPDGSGTLFDFAELNTNTTRQIIGKVYGTDFAYHEITGTYQKPIRYPVFGIMEEYYYYTYEEYDIDDDETPISSVNIAGNIVDTVKNYNEGVASTVCKGQEGTLNTKYKDIIFKKDIVESEPVTDKRGFVAIIEEGDALAELSTYHAGGLSDYNTIKMTVTPRPKDSYNLQDSISVGANSDWTVVCDRKYVGSYKMKYILLSDSTKLNLPEGQSASDYTTYDTSWLGMAVAYRDYLVERGVIDQLQPDELTADIPLYIETFGAVETTKKILSIPVDVMESLTTFDEVLEMYTYLSGEGIKNINFKLTGYANGGMYYAVPGNLKFERVVGGKDGFQELLDAAAAINAADKDSNLGIFPDFDIVYEIDDDWFNGYQRYDHAAKTIDDRYASRREYSATQQKYINYYEIVISPAYYDVIYNRIAKNYSEGYKNVVGISVSTLGQWLHSDFDEDEPYNREDSKKFTIEAFEHFDATYSEVMTSGGNAYVWKYVDHMLDVSLDSSRYTFSSNAVPFIGVVLHGSISFTGEPLNMEGDIQYAILKAIENGASPYFILSMDNTHILKEYFDLSQYYSIRYDIWKEDIADVYSTLNNVLFDVQDKYIIGHDFLTGNRIPDSDELEADIYNEYLKDLAAEKNAADILAAEIALSASAARENGKIAEKEAAKALLLTLNYFKSFNNDVHGTLKIDENYFGYAKAAYIAYYSAMLGDDEAAKTYTKLVLDNVTNFNIPSNYFETVYNAMLADKAKLDAELNVAQKVAMKSALKKALMDKGLFDAATADDYAEQITNAVFADDYTGDDWSDFQATVSGMVSKPNDVGTLVDSFMAELVELVVAEVEALQSEIKAEEEAAETETETESESETETEEDKTAEYESELKEAIKSKLSSVLSGEKAGQLAESIAKAIIEKGITATTAADVENIVETKVGEFYTADNEAEGEIETALFRTFINNVTTKGVDANFKTSGGKTQIADLYGRYNSELSAGENATLPVISDELNAFADAYMKTVAANSAMQLLLRDGFSSDLDESLEKYTANCMNKYEEYKSMYFDYEKTTNYYSTIKTSIIAGKATDEAEALYDKYVAAITKKDSVEKAITAAYESSTKGTIDNYVEALAKLAALAELGFEGSEDAYLVDADGEVTYTKGQTYNDVKDQVSSVRTTAIQATVRLGSSNYSYIKEYYLATIEHLDKATAAIEVLADAEGITLEYEKCTCQKNREVKIDCTARHIVISDDIKNNAIVKQAIDRAIAVIDYLEKDRFELITVGRETNLTLNGHKLRVDRDSTGKTYYFYGTAETGYSYFTYDEKTGEFSVYEGFGNRGFGKMTDKYGNEAEIFELKEKINGMTVYYTASLEHGFIYYVKDEYRSDEKNIKYVEIDRFTTYSGDVFQVVDGVEIRYDAAADVYYSVNADGTYNLYNYSMSIEDYYKIATEASAETIDEILGLIADCKANGSVLDPEFKEAVDKRMPKDEDGKDDEGDKKEEETTSRYTTENIVVVTYGKEMGDPYKSIILNYNNYTVNVVYDGTVYTIPAYEFVVIEYKTTNN